MPHSDVSTSIIPSIDRSNLPHQEKTAIRRFYNQLRGHTSAIASRAQSALGLSSHTVVEGTRVLRKTGEAGILGGLLGIADAKMSASDPSKSGLDVNVNIGDGYNVPVDAVAGGLAFLASMHPKTAMVAEDLQTAGIVGVASFAQRKAKAWYNAAPASGAAATTPAAGAATTPAAGAAASKAAGEFGQEDAVLAWARQQG